MMGFRVLMYTGGMISACVYFAQIRQVRSLTETAEELEEELENDELDEPTPPSSHRDEDPLSVHPQSSWTYPRMSPHRRLPARSLANRSRPCSRKWTAASGSIGCSGRSR